METKTCFACKETKPVAEFYQNAGHTDGLSSRCVTCTQTDMRDRWRAKHPERAAWVMPTEKRCNGCGETKPLEDFHRHSRHKDGRQARCKICQTQSVLTGYRDNPQRHAAYNREWSRKNRDRKADIALKTRFGLPHGTYARLLSKQDGRCAICRTDTPRGHGRFHVDHDELTGAVRGLLCTSCNTGIGQLKHSKEILLAAVDYLDNHFISQTTLYLKRRTQSLP